MRLAMIDDKIVQPNELADTYLDRGTFFGDGVYEVIRSYKGKIFAFDDHMQRFANSLDAVKISSISIDVVRDRVLKAFEQANIPNAKIYFHVTRGSQIRNHTCPAELKPNFFLTIEELGDATAVKQAGIKVSTYPDLRWKRCDIKSLNLLANVMAKMDSESKGCDEAILVDESTGLITEGSGSAFFGIFNGGELWTTPLGYQILPSITRKYVVQAATNAGMKIVETQFTPEQATKADELIMAVTTKDIVPIVEFDGVAINGGKPGPWAIKLMEEFKAFIG